VQGQRVVLNQFFHRTRSALGEPPQRHPGQLVEEPPAHRRAETRVDDVQPQQQRGAQAGARAQQHHEHDDGVPHPRLVGSGQQQAGQFDQHHERGQLQQGDQRLKDTTGDQLWPDRGQQMRGGLRTPPAS
jgi:hypothetical protein